MYFFRSVLLYTAAHLHSEKPSISLSEFKERTDLTTQRRTRCTSLFIGRHNCNSIEQSFGTTLWVCVRVPCVYVCACVQWMGSALWEYTEGELYSPSEDGHTDLYLNLLQQKAVINLVTFSFVPWGWAKIDGASNLPSI